jgi:TonB family protein
MKPLAIAAALVFFATSTAAAQRTRLEVSTAETPTCTDAGVQRVAVMVPPGKTREEISNVVATGGMFPEGTQVVILELGEYTPMQNEAEVTRRMNFVLQRFLDEGTQIDGTLSVLLTVDEGGVVTDARPNSGNAHVDRTLRDAWKQARFAPYAIGGCRMKAWISIPYTFSSDWSLTRREVQMRPAVTP